MDKKSIYIVIVSGAINSFTPILGSFHGHADLPHPIEESHESSSLKIVNFGAVGSSITTGSIDFLIRAST